MTAQQGGRLRHARDARRVAPRDEHAVTRAPPLRGGHGSIKTTVRGDDVSRSRGPRSPDMVVFMFGGARHLAVLVRAGLRDLARLPKLREITLEGLPHVTADGVDAFSPNVRVNILSE